MINMPEYYKNSDSYAEMLRNQDLSVFMPYVDLFKKFAKPSGSVIDIGCGVGTSTVLLRQAGFDAMGTDISEKFLPATKDKFCVVDFQNAEDIPSNTYSAVGTMNVIEHVENPRNFLAEIVRVVQPGGKIILMAPNLTSPIIPVGIVRDLLKKNTPYLGITSLSKACALVGVNFWRSLRAEFGMNAFEMRKPILDNGIAGYDADAVYWTNAREISRFLKSKNCEILLFQKQGSSTISKLIASLLPGFAGKVCIVAQKN